MNTERRSYAANFWVGGKPAVEKGPKKRHKEKDLRDNKQDHSPTKPQLNDGRVKSLVGPFS